MSDDTGAAEGDTKLERPARSETVATDHAGARSNPVAAEAAVLAARRYEVSGELAHGGLGRIMRARDLALDREVAIKEPLDPEDPGDRIRAEAKVLARLQHPSIVPIYDTGTRRDGVPFFAMQLVNGGSLRDVIRNATTLEERLSLVPVVVATAEAIAYAHSQGVIHRDLKPHNVLVGAFGETIVIDWGLAVVGDEPSAGANGTPPYMPPEQARGEPIDARADVYAIGAILYDVLAGHAPYAGVPGEALEVVRAGPPVPIATVEPRAPADLVAIVTTAMARDPAARYATAKGLAEDLVKFQTGRLVSARQYSAIERLGRFVRRHRISVTIAVGAAIVLAVGAWLAVDRIVAARDREHARADDLALSQARLLLDTNPTAAIAVARPLATTEHWRESRDVAAAASARGVAWRYPGPAHVAALAIAPAGGHAVCLGGDGTVQLYDLGAHGVSAISSQSPPSAVVFIDDQRLAIAAGNGVELVDLVTRAPIATVALAAPAVELAARAGTLYGRDAGGHVWRLRQGRAAIEPIAVDDEIQQVVPSPDGKRAALRGARAIWLIDDVATKLVEAPAVAVAWNDAGDELAVAHADALRTIGDVTTIALAEPTVAAARLHGLFATQLAFARGHVIARTAVAFRTDRELDERYPLGTTTIGLAIGWGGVIVGAATDGTLPFWDGGRRGQLATPTRALEAIAAAPGARYVVGAGRGDVFVWDLGAVVARRIEIERDPYLVGRAGAHHVLYVDQGRVGHWVDLATGVSQPGPRELDPSTHVVAAPSGDRVVLVAMYAHTALATRYGTERATPLATGVEFAVFVDDHRVALAHSDGQIVIADLDGGTTTTVAAAGASVRMIAPDGDALVFARDNGVITRASLATGAATTAGPYTSLARGTAMTADGRVWVADGRSLLWWGRDGQRGTHAILDAPIKRVSPIDDHRVAVDTADGGYVADGARPGSLVPTHSFARVRALDAEPLRFWWSVTGATPVRVVDDDRGPMVIDAETGAAWRVGQPGAPGERPDHAELASDATRIYELRDTELLVWDVALPPTAADTAAMLDALTNALAGRLGALSWRE